MEYKSVYMKRRRLLRSAGKGHFELIMSKDFVVKGLVLPRTEKKSLLKIMESDAEGEFGVLWRDSLGGETILRWLESDLSVAKLMNCPDLKVRIHITDCCGNSEGFIEPELMFGFIPDWEERL